MGLFIAYKNKLITARKCVATYSYHKEPKVLIGLNSLLRLPILARFLG